MDRRHFLKTMTIASAAIALPKIAAAATHQVAIQGMAFSPASLTVSPGDVIVFTNMDNAPHTATATDGSWDTGRLNRGQSAEVQVAAGMNTDYICAFHRSMKGSFSIG